MERPLSPQLFAIFRLLVEEHVGLSYRSEDAELLAERIHGRMREVGFESALDYYYRLRYDDPDRAELEALVDNLVVGETYFFRELDPLKASVEHVVARAVRERGRAFIWSAACATGEEPLTLAILLAEAGLLERCEIRATDVSRRALRRAHEGRYGARSLRALAGGAEAARLAERWLEIAPGGETARPRPELLAAIDYRQGNLLGPPSLDELGCFDLILCRNVLIYFAEETILRVVGRLTNALRPGGRLLVGAAESLLRLGTLLQCEERGGAFFYARASP